MPAVRGSLSPQGPSHLSHRIDAIAGEPRIRSPRSGSAGPSEETRRPQSAMVSHMRIALLPSAYAPAVGGVEELTARLAHRFQGAGDDVEVWTNRHPADLPPDESVDGIR